MVCAPYKFCIDPPLGGVLYASLYGIASFMYLRKSSLQSWIRPARISGGRSTYCILIKYFTSHISLRTLHFICFTSLISLQNQFCNDFAPLLKQLARADNHTPFCNEARKVAPQGRVTTAVLYQQLKAAGFAKTNSLDCPVLMDMLTIASAKALGNLGGLLQNVGSLTNLFWHRGVSSVGQSIRRLGDSYNKGQYQDGLRAPLIISLLIYCINTMRSSCFLSLTDTMRRYRSRSHSSSIGQT
jgi:hypothetical protein